jgi:hypothetical protein
MGRLREAGPPAFARGVLGVFLTSGGIAADAAVDLKQ